MFMQLTTKLIDTSFFRPLYQDKSRVYHGVEHIHRLLDLIGEQQVSDDERRFLVACAWLHDAIYDAKQGSPANEEQSAALLDRTDLSLGLTEKGKELARQTILATAKHTQDQTNLHKLTALFLDLDLMGLAGTYEDFVRHSQLISKEYRLAGVTDEQLMAGHGQFFEKMNSRASFFYSEGYRYLDQFVRDNLKRAMTDPQKRFVETDLIDDPAPKSLLKP